MLDVGYRLGRDALARALTTEGFTHRHREAELKRRKSAILSLDDAAGIRERRGQGLISSGFSVAFGGVEASAAGRRGQNIEF
jgi:hypothetical protein